MPFGDFQSQTGFESFGGFGRRQSEIAPLMPSQQEVTQAYDEQNQEPSLFWRLLGLPSRLLGSQSITGFVEGATRDGIGEGLRLAAKNNPISQLLEFLTPGNTGLVEDKSFSDIRKNLQLEYGDKGTDKGWENLLINTAGDMLLDPFGLFFRPFALLKNSGEAATMFTKGAAKFGIVNMEHALQKTPISMLTAVTDINSPVRRALLTFKIPFTDQGFVVQPLKRMDVALARSLEGAAGWLNTNPLTSSIIQTFSKGTLAVKDATQRAAAKILGREGQAAGDWIRGTFVPLLNKAIRDLPETAKGDNRINLLATLMGDWGAADLNEVSDLVQMLEKDSILTAHAKARTRSLLGQFGPDVDELAGMEARGGDLARKLAKSMESDNQDAVLNAAMEWKKNFPEAALPQSFLQKAEGVDVLAQELRPGVDFWDYEKQYLPRDIRAENIATRPVELGVNPPPPGTVENPGPVGAAREATRGLHEEAISGAPVAPGTTQRAATARGTLLPSREADARFRATARQLVEGIVNDYGKDGFEKARQIALFVQETSQRLGLVDEMEGLLNQTMEFYLPRNLSPKYREMLNVASSKFFEGRKVQDMSALEFNLFVHEYGTKLTNGRPVSMMAKEGHVTVMEALTKLFPEDLVKTLMKAGRAGDEAAMDTAGFLVTNPFYNIWRRIEQSSLAHNRAKLVKGFFSEEMPFVQETTKVGEFAKNQEQVYKQRKGFFVDPNKRPFYTALNNGEHMEAGLKLNARAQIAEMREETFSFFSDLLKKLRGKAGSSTPTDAHGIYGAALDKLRELRDFKLKDIENGIPTEFEGHVLIRNLQRQRELTTRGALLDMSQEDAEAIVRQEWQAQQLAKQNERYAAMGREEAAKKSMARSQQEVDYHAADVKAQADVTRSYRRESYKAMEGESILAENRAMEAYAKQDRILSESQALKSAAKEDVAGYARQARKASKEAEKAREMYRAYLRSDEDITDEAIKLLGERKNQLAAQSLGELQRLRIQAKTIRQGLSERVAEFRDIGRQIIKGVKGETPERMAALKNVLNADPHGGDLVDEIRLALEYEKQGILPLQTLQQNHPDLYEKFLKKNPEATIHWVDGEVADRFLGENGLVNNLFRPSRMAQAFPAWFDGMTQWWKSITVLNPLFVKARVRDVMANAMTFHMGTDLVPSLLGHGKAAAVAKYFEDVLSNGGVEAEKKVMQIGGETYTYKQIIDEMMKSGVGASGITRDAMGTVMSGIPGIDDLQKGGRTMLSRLYAPTGGWWTHLGGQVAEFGDNTSKLAAAFNQMEKRGMSLEDAFASIKPYVYDGGKASSSNAERYLFRKILPFYNYTKFAVQQTTNALFQKPGMVTWIEKVHENSKKAAGMNDAQFEAFMPEFVKTNLGIPVESTKDGIRVKIFGNFIPMGEVVNLATAIEDAFDSTKESGIKDYIGQRLNPLIKLPIESAINRSFFTHRNIQQYEGQTTEMFGATTIFGLTNISPRMKNTLMSLRFLNEIDNLNVLNFGDVENLLSAQGAVKRANQGETTLLERLFSQSQFSPNPFGVGRVVSAEFQGRVMAGQQTQALNTLKHELRKEVELGQGEVKTKNMAQLRKLLASKEAEILAREQVEQRFGIQRR